MEIPKENGKTRPLSIYCYEDKLVQEALRRILEGVFESHFYEGMMGFRPNRGCHDAIRMLKAGVMEDYTYSETKEGSGQGSVCSPIIANIYMHYAVVWWYKEKIQPLMRGYSGLVVYADDFVACFQYKSDAQMFYELLKKRMGHFGLELQEEKSRLIEFGRFAQENAAKRGIKAGTLDIQETPRSYPHTL